MLERFDISTLCASSVSVQRKAVMVKCPKCGGSGFQRVFVSLDEHGSRADFIVCDNCKTAIGATASTDEIEELQSAIHNLSSKIEELQEKLRSS